MLHLHGGHARVPRQRQDPPTPTPSLPSDSASFPSPLEAPRCGTYNASPIGLNFFFLACSTPLSVFPVQKRQHDKLRGLRVQRLRLRGLRLRGRRLRPRLPVRPRPRVEGLRRTSAERAQAVWPWIAAKLLQRASQQMAVVATAVQVLRVHKVQAAQSVRRQALGAPSLFVP